MSDKTVYRPKEIASRFGVGLSKVLGWIHAGELQAVNIASRADMQPRFVVTAEALAEFERSRTTTKPTAVKKSFRSGRRQESGSEYAARIIDELRN